MAGKTMLAADIKGQITRYSGISKGLPKSKQKLVREMVYVIQAGKDIKLSNVSRNLYI